MSNRETAISFLKMASSGNVQAAYDQFVAPSFIHHNQYFKGDRESLLRAMQDASAKSPNQSFEPKQVFEEGENVITHSLVTRKDPKAPSIAVVHIFRFQSGKIVELWDLGQAISPDSPNENGLF